MRLELIYLLDFKNSSLTSLNRGRPRQRSAFCPVNKPRNGDQMLFKGVYHVVLSALLVGLLGPCRSANAQNTAGIEFRTEFTAGTTLGQSWNLEINRPVSGTPCIEFEKSDDLNFQNESTLVV